MDKTPEERIEFDLRGLLEQIERDKLARLEQLAPVDRRLTQHDAMLWLSRKCLQKPELIALIQGMVPVDGETSMLDTAGYPVVQRLLADEAKGYVRFPIRSDEAVTWLLHWYEELCDALQFALEKPAATAGEQTVADRLQTGSASMNARERKNSSDTAVREVKRCLDNAIDLLRSAGLDTQPDELPGTKAPYHEFMRKHSARLKELSDETLDDYRSRCGYCCRKTGGKRRAETDNRIRRILDLSSREVMLAASKVKAGALDTHWLSSLPRK